MSLLQTPVRECVVRPGDDDSDYDDDEDDDDDDSDDDCDDAYLVEAGLLSLLIVRW